MIIYNVTVNIDDSVHDEWITWMRSVHIPDVMNTGFFIENRMLRILGDEESGGHTYSIQYSCESMEKLKMYQEKYAPALQKAHSEKYKDKFVAFRTLLELV
ncbi:MAG: DUF4286 family protein [Bacteroidetes bacterium]|nr:MAG: DUF4286 family protein [Bacteroidota bacterium]REK04946.1 MAG: DUF4286 family protein [Bacteroidota bacterium]REK36550.1 MAG: DUF4286 family protein [Bacteroidota bacterium]REK50916.1 MAG: DUF4286 family protein [Bacteroidota bacterium]